jgi:hypothetical protein
MFSPLAAAFCGSQVGIEIGNWDSKNRMIADCVIVETVVYVEKSNTAGSQCYFPNTRLRLRASRASAASCYS